MQRWLTRYAVNYYDVLGLKPNASQAQIKTAYYQLSKLYHPDTTEGIPNAKEKFAKLSAAYEVLGNPHKRALYDRHHPSASARPIGNEDVEYRDFLRRRGTFSPRHGAGTTFTTGTSAGTEFDKFYKQHYGNAIKYNREQKKYNKQRMKQQTQGAGDSSDIVLGFLLTALVCAFFLFK